MTPEGKVKKRVKELLSDVGAYYYMPVSNGMGAPSLDFIGCYKGAFFGIETKAGNKGMTARQFATAKRIEDAGGLTFLVNDDETTLIRLKLWLSSLDYSE